MVITGGEQRRFNRRGDVSRQKILAATMRIAAQEGHRAATISRITEETGVSASSIFWHFHNKQELVALALDNGRTVLLEQSADWEPSSEAAGDAESLLGNLTWWSDKPGLTGYWRVGLTLALEGSPEDAELRAGFLEFRRVRRAKMRRWWLHELSRSGPAGGDITERALVLADFTTAALDGLFISAALGAPVPRSQSLGLCHGLLAMAHAEHLTPPAQAVIEGAEFEGASSASARDRLTRAASVVLARHGFHGATIAKICREAGLPASSLYWSFKDKDELVAAVISEGYAARHGSSLAVGLPEHSDQWRREFAHSLARHLAWTEKFPQATRLGQLLALQQGSGGGQGRAAFASRRLEFNHSVAQWLAHHAPEVGADAAQDVAGIAMLLIDGLFLASQLGDGPRAPEESAAWVTLLLEGAAAA